MLIHDNGTAVLSDTADALSLSHHHVYTEKQCQLSYKVGTPYLILIILVQCHALTYLNHDQFENKRN